MPYHYQESTHLSRENSLALQSLKATGELPTDHYWNALRTQHDANSARFDRTHNYVIAALLDRDEGQRQGTVTANAPLFHSGGFFAYAEAKHDLNATRFDHWHPFLGHLFEIVLPATPAGETVTPPATTTTTPGTAVTPTTTTTTGTTPSGSSTSTSPNSPSQLLPSSGTNSGGAGSNAFTPSSVPEPASALMLGMALTLTLAGMMLARLFRRGRTSVAEATPA